MVETLKQSANGVSIILDPMKFRRAGLASVLAPWAVENSIRLEQSSPDDPDMHSIPDLRMAILNLGGTSIAEKDSLLVIEKLHDLAPEIRIAIISDREATNEVVAAFRSGAHGYIPTSTEPLVALQALSFVLAGGSFFPPTVLLNKQQHHSAPRTTPRRDKDAPLSPSRIFTPSQLRVMAQLKDGKSNKLIARNLRLCEATVKLHVRQIMRKLGASNRTQVAIYCSTDGEVEEILRISEQTRPIIEDRSSKYPNVLINGAAPPDPVPPSSDGSRPSDSHSD